MKNALHAAISRDEIQSRFAPPILLILLLLRPIAGYPALVYDVFPT
jgi:hypothetical protein